MSMCRSPVCEVTLYTEPVFRHTSPDSVQTALAYRWRGSNTLKAQGRLTAPPKGKAVKVLMEIQLKEDFS